MKNENNTISNIKIENKNGKLVMSSRLLAIGVKKEHTKVIRTLDDILHQKPNLAFDIILSKYQTGTGKKYKEYLLTKRGMNLYLFNIEGFLDYKIALLDKFETIEQELLLLTNQPLPPTTTQLVSNFLNQYFIFKDRRVYEVDNIYNQYKNYLKNYDYKVATIKDFKTALLNNGFATITIDRENKKGVFFFELATNDYIENAMHGIRLYEEGEREVIENYLDNRDIKSIGIDNEEKIKQLQQEIENNKKQIELKEYKIKDLQIDIDSKAYSQKIELDSLKEDIRVGKIDLNADMVKRFVLDTDYLRSGNKYSAADTYSQYQIWYRKHHEDEKDYNMSRCHFSKAMVKVGFNRTIRDQNKAFVWKHY